MTVLAVRRAGPAMSLQDPGRRGWMGQGLSRGGAADMLALAEGAALLGQEPCLAALEMIGFGGSFEVLGGSLRVAFTGAPMWASCDGEALAWNASHFLTAGQNLEIGGVEAGVYGYLHVGGGFEGEMILGSRAAHLSAGIGRPVAAGDELRIGRDPGGPVGMAIPVSPRFSGGMVRMLPGIQTERFAHTELERFQATTFRVGLRANRMGVMLEFDGPGFVARNQLGALSEVIVPGDIQMTGDGLPYVLMQECQTIGGYPRIGTVLPCDLPLVAQASPGKALRFALMDIETGQGAQARHAEHLAALARSVAPRIRRVEEVADLLSFQLVDGAVSALSEED